MCLFTLLILLLLPTYVNASSSYGTYFQENTNSFSFSFPNLLSFFTRYLNIDTEYKDYLVLDDDDNGDDLSEIDKHNWWIEFDDDDDDCEDWEGNCQDSWEIWKKYYCWP